MPSSIYVTKEQIKELAKVDADVVVNEVSLIGEALDFWVMDEASTNGQHRSLVIEKDGTVISDAVVPDTI